MNHKGMLEVRLSFPDMKALGGNSKRVSFLGDIKRAHRSRAEKETRKIMRLWGVRVIPPVLTARFSVPIDLKFYPPHFRYDDDNILRACKQYRDGLQDALGMNDKRFAPCCFVTAGKDKHDPHIVILIGNQGRPFIEDIPT